MTDTFFFQLLESRFPDLYAVLRYIIRGFYIDTQKETRNKTKNLYIVYRIFRNLELYRSSD